MSSEGYLQCRIVDDRDEGRGDWTVQTRKTPPASG
jgi:hypothetical protein